MLERLTSLFLRKRKPFLDTRAAQLWWKPFDQADAGTQLHKVSNVFADFLAGERHLSRDALLALLWLDNAVQPAFEAVCFQYVSNPRMPKELEQRLWKQVTTFAQQVVDAYQLFVRQEGDEDGKTASAAEVPLATARSLRYLGVQAKWHYFRFEKAPAKLWMQASQIYRLAEIAGFDSNPFSLYPSLSPEVTSCADEYLQLLMLATLSSNNLSVSQIDWVDGWLESWSKLLQLSRKHQASRHHYCVCLQDGTGPQKIGPEADDETYRYWGIAELVAKVQETLSRLEGGATPKSLGLGDACNTAVAAELLKHLDVFWTMSMRNCQVQRNERRKVNKAVNVIHGLDNLCTHVREDNDRVRKMNGAAEDQTKVDYDEVLDMRLYGFVSDRTRQKATMNPYVVQTKQHDWQTWAIDNESVSGLGAVLAYSANDWVRPGVLVGVRADARGHWQVGVLRRLNRLNDDEVYAGIQILATTPVAVNMHSEELDRVENFTVAELGFHGNIEVPNARTGIYLPHKIDGANVNTLIIHSADYSQGRIYQVQARDKVFSVSLGNVLEKGVDWVWIAVNVLRQEA